METNIFSEILAVLRRGGVILYPTDTVWGIGCDATNPEAVERVYRIKRRSDSKSLVLLADSLDMVCRFVQEVPEIAVQLVEVNDKPMTIVYPQGVVGPEQGGLAANVVAGDGSVGIRIPLSDFCRNLVRRFGHPIVSTSANISGQAAPVKYSGVSREIRDAVDYIVDPTLEAGATGVASSIIKIGVDGTVEIIRG